MIFYDDGRYNEQHIMNESSTALLYYVSDKDQLSPEQIGKLYSVKYQDLTKPYIAICCYCEDNDIDTPGGSIDSLNKEIYYPKQNKNHLNDIIYLYECECKSMFGINYKPTSAKVVDSGKLSDMAKKYGIKLIETKHTDLNNNRADVYKKVMASLKKAINSSPYKSKVKFINNNTSTIEDEYNSETESLKRWINCDTTLMSLLRVADISELNLQTSDQKNKFEALLDKAYKDAHVMNPSYYSLLIHKYDSKPPDYIYLDDNSID